LRPWPSAESLRRQLRLQLGDSLQRGVAGSDRCFFGSALGFGGRGGGESCGALDVAGGALGLLAGRKQVVAAGSVMSASPIVSTGALVVT
jgi:hypothetical protein